MFKDLPQDFKCLLLFAALSGREFVKSELDIKMTIAEIDALNQHYSLLAITKKGQSRSLRSNSQTISWAAENLNTELAGKNKAVRAVLDLVRARTAAYLKARQISISDFLEPANNPHDEPVASKALESSDPVEAVRQAYLKLSGGSHKARILLKDLRKHLSIDRGTQDAAFKELIRTGEADFYPEDDPVSLNEEDHRAALQIADRYRHVIYLHPEPRA